MNKKLYHIINGILLFLLVVATSLYKELGTPYVFKTLASCAFLVVAIFNFIVATLDKTTPKNYKLLMLIGLFFAAAGDIFLIDYFEVGAILFAIGHIFYFIGFCTIKKINWLDLILFVVIFVACLLVIFLYKGFDFKGMLALIIVYALIISGMLAKAIANCIKSHNFWQSINIAIGALLFFISDVCLLFFVFGEASIIVDNICLYTYYIGQGILASSLYFLNIKSDI